MQQSLFRFWTWLIRYHITYLKTLLMKLILMDLLAYTFIWHLESLCRYGNPFWLLKRNKQNWTPFLDSYAGPAYIFTMESIYYIIILYWMMLYYYILSFVCYAYWLLLYLEERNKQQYISLLRTKWKFDIKYLLSNYQSTTWPFITYYFLDPKPGIYTVYTYVSANGVSCRIFFF